MKLSGEGIDSQGHDTDFSIDFKPTSGLELD